MVGWVDLAFYQVQDLEELLNLPTRLNLLTVSSDFSPSLSDILLQSSRFHFV